MKSILLFSAFLLSGIAGRSQTAKQVSINELNSYIENSERPLVINFWATWCSPCLHELPYFVQTVKKYKGQHVELVLVNMDMKKNFPLKVNESIKRNQMQGTFFWLNETNADVFCPIIDPKWDGGIPATLFVNKSLGYRKFFERQLTERQFEAEVKLLVGN